MINGNTLIEWGFKPGAWFKPALFAAQNMAKAGHPEEAIKEYLTTQVPPEIPVIALRTNKLPFGVFLEPETDVETENYHKVIGVMDELVRVPTIVKAAVMPDACPAGTIPVGAVVATKGAIHPGFHSADACCSMAITVFKRKDDLKRILDLAQSITHFGPGGRKGQEAIAHTKMGGDLAADISSNKFLGHDLLDMAQATFGTQGDGNHFLYVGTLRSTGQPAIVTHHGSRGLGAMLYRKGMAAAKRHTKIVSPRTPDGASWIEADTEIGDSYWKALQIVREWTKRSHFSIHDRIQRVLGNQIVDRFWNEHNFVFRRSDGLFYHAKGATPSYKGFSPDDDGRTLIPMNMAEPILIAGHTENEDALGFAPHGAGRNMSRTQFLKENDPDIAELTKGIDVRSYNGRLDLAELPSAYKNADQVIRSIRKHRLANINDYVDPYGSIMAGAGR